MSLTRITRISRPANAAIGYQGHRVGAVGLRGSFDLLKRTVENGWARSQAG